SYDQAVPALKRARELAPGLRTALLPLAKALAKTGQRDEAMQVLRALVEAKPTPQEVKVARALATEIGDAFGAIPASARPKVEEGLKWLDQYDAPQKAIVSFEEVLSQFPDLATV